MVGRRVPPGRPRGRPAHPGGRPRGDGRGARRRPRDRRRQHGPDLRGARRGGPRGRGRRSPVAGIGPGDRVGVRIPSGTAELYMAILAVLARRRGLRAGRRRRPRRARADRVPRGRGRPGAHRGRTCAGAAAAPAEPPAARRSTTTRGSSSRPARRARPRASRSRTGRPPRSSTPRRGCSSQDAPLGPGDRVLAGLSVAFDATCEEMWLAWAHGACLVPAPRALVRTGMDLGPVAGRAGDHRHLDRADARRAVARRGARRRPAADLRRRGVPARARRAPVGDGPRGLEHLRPDRGDRRRVRRAADRRRARADRATARRVGPRGRRRPTGRQVDEGGLGELVIGGVGLARYLDPVKDAEKFAPRRARSGWERAYRSGDLVALRARRAAVRRARRRPGQGRRPADRAGRGRRRAARRCPGSRARPRPCAGPRPGTPVLVGYLVPDARRRRWTWPTPGTACASTLPASLVPLLAVVDAIPTRSSGQGRPRRAAVAAGRRRRPTRRRRAVGSPRPAGWVAEQWTARARRRGRRARTTTSSRTAAAA